MGAIDPLLGIVQMKKASGLVLASDEVPALLLGGTRSPLTMPRLSAAMVQDLVEEILSVAERATLLSDGRVESVHDAGSNGTFAVKATQASGKTTLSLTKASAARGAASAVPVRAAAAAAPPAAPAVPPTPAPTPTAPAAPPASPTAAAPTTFAPIVAAPAAASPAVARAIGQAIARHASDLLLSSGAAPLLRIDDELAETRAPALDEAELLAHFIPLLGPERQRAFAAGGSVDFAIVHEAPGAEAVRLRANLFRHSRGVAVALRPIWPEIPTLEELALPPRLVELTTPRTGLVLVAGATGAGKSTTLAALVEHVNRTRACHVVTLEDPIEYVYRWQRAIVHQREVGEHVGSFALGLRAALREDPDIILVGEMRDAETIRLALTAAETGHLVLSTLHSGSAVMAIERIIDVFGDSEKLHIRQQLAGVLRHVVAQQLVPSVDGRRLPVLEVLAVNHAVAAQIRDGRTHMLATQIEIGGDEGMVPMERALADLVRAGRVSRPVALAAAPARETLQRLLDERSVSPRR